MHNSTTAIFSRSHSDHEIGFRRAFVALASLALLVVFAVPASAETRTLRMYFTHTKESATITFKKNGRYLPAGLKKANRFLRDWRRKEPTRMDPELLDLVWEVYQKSGSRKPIHVISAYRSPRTNNMLRRRGRKVAKTSQHTRGKALDFFMPDVKVTKLRELGLKAHRGGVGYYRGSFVHLDTGRVRHWPRMSRSQLARVFPRGRTIHVPSNGKPLKGYKVAMANLKKGLNHDGSKRGTTVKRSLIASLFGTRGNDGDEREGAAEVAAAKPQPKPRAKPEAKPVQVAAAPKTRKGVNPFARELKAVADASPAAVPVPGQKPETETTELASLVPERPALPRRRPAVEVPAPAAIAEAESDRTPIAVAALKPAAPATPTQLALSAPASAGSALRPSVSVPGGAPAAPDDEDLNLLKQRITTALARQQTVTSAQRAAEDLANGNAPRPPAPVGNAEIAMVTAEPPRALGATRPTTPLSAADIRRPQRVAYAAPEAAVTPNWREQPATASIAADSRPVAETQVPLPTQPVLPAAAPARETAALAPVLAPRNDARRNARDDDAIVPVAVTLAAAVPLRSELSIGDLKGASVTGWAVAQTTRLGSAAQLKAPAYLECAKRAAPAQIFATGFTERKLKLRADRFSKAAPTRLAFADFASLN